MSIKRTKLLVWSCFIFQTELQSRCCVVVCSAKRPMYDNLHLKSFGSVPLSYWRKNELINRSLTCAYLPSQVITNNRWLAKTPQTTQYILWLIFYTSSQHIASHKSQLQHVIKGERKKIEPEHTVSPETMLLHFCVRYLCLRCVIARSSFFISSFLFLVFVIWCAVIRVIPAKPQINNSRRV